MLNPKVIGIVIGLVIGVVLVWLGALNAFFVALFILAGLSGSSLLGRSISSICMSAL